MSATPANLKNLESRPGEPMTLRTKGERFLMMTKVREDTANLAARPNVRVVLNWFEEFREKK